MACTRNAMLLTAERQTKIKEVFCPPGPEVRV